MFALYQIDFSELHGEFESNMQHANQLQAVTGTYQTVIKRADILYQFSRCPRCVAAQSGTVVKFEKLHTYPETGTKRTNDGAMRGRPPTPRVNRP